MASLKFMIAFLILINSELILAMTRAQLKKTMGVMKKQCMGKIAVTEDKVGKIEEGVFPEEHNVMCFILCVYQIGLVIKNGRLDMDSVYKQVDIMYPADMKERAKAAVNKCKTVQDKYSDSCEGVFHAAKCMQEADPENFVFP